MKSSLFDTDRIVAETFVARAEHYATVTSTNDLAGRSPCKDAPCTGANDLPLLIVADQQTAGRGRGGHCWWTGPGSLAMSLLLDETQVPTIGPSQSPLLALSVAVALVETLDRRIPSDGLGIHWPNDVLAAGRKLAGILVEVTPDRRYIVGIGVNTNNSPADVPTELKSTAVTLLELTGHAHDHTLLLIDLLRNLQQAFELLGSAPESIGHRADQLCLQHGKQLTLRLGNRTISGQCVGIASDGALLLDTSTGRQTFYSGVLSPE